MINPCTSRYPIKKHRYLESVGKLLPHRIGQILKQLGFHTKVESVHSNGVDLKVYNHKELVLVAEILNWSPYTLLSRRRKRCITRNLARYSCRKVLIYTAMKNEEMLYSLGAAVIDIVCLDCQILPKVFFEFFEVKNQIQKRVIDSRKTRQHVTQKISEFLASVGIFPLLQDQFRYFAPLDKFTEYSAMDSSIKL